MSKPYASPEPDFTGPLRGSEMESATLASLDRLREVLSVHPQGADRFRAVNEAGRFGRIFGGQLFAQAMCAAAATAPELSVHAVQASFLRPGDASSALDITVERTRDGRTMSTRQVTVEQGGRALLIATVSLEACDSNGGGDDDPAGLAGDPAGADPAELDPEDLPLLQHWALHAPPPLAAWARVWIEQPTPLEVRSGEPPAILGGERGSAARSYWMRLPRPIEHDPLTNAVLLGYASDYLLVDTAFRAHPGDIAHATHIGLTLDHALWLHRPLRFDQWHVYRQQTVAVAGHRALVHGTVADLTGRVVASTSQAVLIRPRVAPPR